MIEDDDPKVRRNLMITSTVILGSAVLGLQPLQLAHELLKLAAFKIEPWRVWTLAAAIQLYFWARFFYLPQTIEKLIEQPDTANEGGEGQYAAEKVPLTFSEVSLEYRPKVLNAVLARQARQSTRVGAKSPCRSLKESVRTVLVNSHPDALPGAEIFLRDRDVKSFENPSGSWSGQVSLTVVSAIKSPFSEPANGVRRLNIFFKADALTRAEVRFRLVCHAAFFSSHGIIANFPNVLGGTAFLFAIGQAIRHAIR